MKEYPVQLSWIRLPNKYEARMIELDKHQDQILRGFDWKMKTIGNKERKR